jgi:hypothetical protein
MNNRDVDASGLLNGLSEADQADVLAEANVLDFLIQMKALMAAQGVGARQLGRNMGAAPGQVSKWLRAATGVNAKTLFRIAAALGYNLELKLTPIKPADNIVYLSSHVQTMTAKRQQSSAYTKAPLVYNDNVEIAC